MQKALLPTTSIVSFVILSFLFSGCNQGDSHKEAVQTAAELPDSTRHLPENALKGLVAADDLSLQLFAHEPMLDNPTDMDIDEKGRIWVCEGFNYRNQINPQNPYRKEGDRILILEDTNGDGVADKQTVFYQGTDIDAALGIAVLGNKVIVSRSPNVVVFTDIDGDGKADKKDTLFTNISGEQHDHAIHAFNFGPDGKLYFNFGNAGHSIRDKAGKPIVDLAGNLVNNSGHPYRQGMVFRCNPDGTGFEVLANNFRNNYEVAEDSYGTMWQSDNDDDGNRGVRINYVMSYGNYGYTDEMTGASWRERRINMEDSIPYRHWHLNDPGVVPNLLQTGAGSPTGILVYEGDLLPQRFRGQLIHSDAGPNVVRSYAVSPFGAGYMPTAINNIVEGKHDNWFRPSDVCIAPDGSLFIADWYDPGVGGHQVGDLTRGRVFRVTIPGHEAYTVPALDLSTPEGAIKALQSPNLSTRYLAWEKLNGWGETAIPVLEGLYHSDNPRMRARALWLLSKIPGKGGRYIDTALTDKEENIRITAIRAGLEIHADTIAIVSALVGDTSWSVRREAVLALRHNSSPAAAGLWAKLALQYRDGDRWYLEALGIAADGAWDKDFAAWKQQIGDWQTPAGRGIVWRARTDAALPLLATIVADVSRDPAANLKFFRAFDFHTGAEKQKVLLSLLGSHHPQQPRIDAIVLSLLDPHTIPMTPSVRHALELGLGAVKGSQDYIDLVSRYQLKDKAPELLSLAKQGPTEDLRSHAVQVLLNSGNSGLLAKAIAVQNDTSLSLIALLGLVEDKKNKDVLQAAIADKNYKLNVRAAAARAMGRDWTGEDRLLAMAKNKTLPEDLRDSTAVILANSNRDVMRKEAAGVLPPVLTGGVNTIAPIDKLLKLPGDAASGNTVFMSYCMACHQVNSKGVNFGPNLSEIGSKLSKEALYAAILQPSAGISFGYEGYVFQLKNGSRLVGYVESQTADEITIKMIGGQSETHKKTDIIEKKDYGKSLMTEGLPQAMGQQKFIDLVEYLSTLKKKG